MTDVTYVVSGFSRIVSSRYVVSGPSTLLRAALSMPKGGFSRIVRPR